MPICGSSISKEIFFFSRGKELINNLIMFYIFIFNNEISTNSQSEKFVISPSC